MFNLAWSVVKDHSKSFQHELTLFLKKKKFSQTLSSTNINKTLETTMPITLTMPITFNPTRNLASKNIKQIINRKWIEIITNHTIQEFM